jgi:restriction system protein
MSLFRIFQKQHTPTTTPIRAGRVAPSTTGLCHETLACMDWHAFERFVELYFQTLGIRTEVLDRNDRTGIMFQLYQPGAEGAYATVKCLARSAHSLDEPILESFTQILVALKIARGMLILNHSASAALRANARAWGCKVLDLDNFWELLMQLDAAHLRPLQNFVREQNVFAPTCPHCSLPLRERTGRTGNRFMACPNFPRCQYTPLHAMKNTASALMQVS